MELYVILVLCLAGTLIFLLGMVCGGRLEHNKQDAVDEKTGYMRGFEDGIKTCDRVYANVNAEEIKKIKATQEEVRNINKGLMPKITADILMAYGVETSSQLPDSVLDVYRNSRGEVEHVTLEQLNMGELQDILKGGIADD